MFAFRFIKPVCLCYLIWSLISGESWQNRFTKGSQSSLLAISEMVDDSVLHLLRSPCSLFRSLNGGSGLEENVLLMTYQKDAFIRKDLLVRQNTSNARKILMLVLMNEHHAHNPMSKMNRRRSERGHVDEETSHRHGLPYIVV